jgi:hypothetical protein
MLHAHHLVRQCASDDHDVALPRAGPEDDAEPVQVVPCSARVHHLHCTARQAEGHGPHGPLARPVHQVVHLQQGIAYEIVRSLDETAMLSALGGVATMT